jgi:hypothetical protein
MRNKSVIEGERKLNEYAHNVDRCVFALRVDEGTRLIAGENNLSMRHLQDLGELPVGSEVYVDFSVTDEHLIAPRRALTSIRSCLADRVRLRNAYAELDTRKLNGQTFPAHRIAVFTGESHTGRMTFAGHTVKDQMTFWGAITGTDPDRQTIEVTMPAGSPEGCQGYRFWRRYGDVAAYEGHNPHWLNPKVKVDALRRWATGGPEARRQVFKVDRSVRVVRNGRPGKRFVDLCVGDKVSVFYQPFYEVQHHGEGVIYPENILASSPIDSPRH